MGRTGKIFGLYGVVFHGVDARDVHKCAALQNQAKNVEKLTRSDQKSGPKFFRESKNEMLGIV